MSEGTQLGVISPAVQQSGKGGTFVVPTVNITPPGGEFGSIPVGAPYFGHEVNNPDICKWIYALVRLCLLMRLFVVYFNGTPAATVRI